MMNRIMDKPSHRASGFFENSGINAHKSIIKFIIFDMELFPDENFVKEKFQYAIWIEGTGECP